MDSKNRKLIPYPKRIHSLILSYQQQKNAQDLETIIRLVDKLVIKIVKQIYRTKDYEFLKHYEANELYDTAIIALEKAISKVKVDDEFTIRRLSSYLSGYISREFKIWFFRKESFVNTESDEEKHEHIYVQKQEIEPIRDIDLVIPGFSQQTVDILKKHLVHRMSLQEIADEMKVKKGYVRYWVDKGKKVLKRFIERERKKNLWRS